MTSHLPVWRSMLFVPVNVEKFVATAHTRGIVHRALRPESLQLVPDPEGIAKALREPLLAAGVALHHAEELAGQFLQVLGGEVDVLQGYHFGRAVPAGEFEALPCFALP